MLKIVCFYFFLHKGWQTSKELKRNMNDGTIAFLMSWCLTLAQVFSCEFCEFSKNTFLTDLLQAAASDF